MSTWKVDFHMGEREDERVVCGPYTYLEHALTRATPQRFFITGRFISDSRNSLIARPVPATVGEYVAHTPAERKLFLDNIVTMLELMEAQRDVDRG